MTEDKVVIQDLKRLTNRERIVELEREIAELREKAAKANRGIRNAFDEDLKMRALLKQEQEVNAAEARVEELEKLLQNILNRNDPLKRHPEWDEVRAALKPVVPAVTVDIGRSIFGDLTPAQVEERAAMTEDKGATEQADECMDKLFRRVAELELHLSRWLPEEPPSLLRDREAWQDARNALQRKD